MLITNVENIGNTVGLINIKFTIKEFLSTTKHRIIITKYCPLATLSEKYHRNRNDR